MDSLHILQSTHLPLHTLSKVSLLILQSFPDHCSSDFSDCDKDQIACQSKIRGARIRIDLLYLSTLIGHSLEFVEVSVSAILSEWQWRSGKYPDGEEGSSAHLVCNREEEEKKVSDVIKGGLRQAVSKVRFLHVLRFYSSYTGLSKLMSFYFKMKHHAVNRNSKLQLIIVLQQFCKKWES